MLPGTPPKSYDSNELDEEYAEEEDSASEDDLAEITKVEEEYAYDPEPPQEGVYGMAVASIILDYRNFLLASPDFHRQSRYACRLFLAMFLTIWTISLQIYLTAMTKFIVTPNAVRELRMAYGDYEFIMYDNNTRITQNGHHRGLDGFFNVSNYKLLDEEEMHSICTCPLAQPLFLSAILLVWTVTCLAYMRQNVTFSIRLLRLKTVRSMKGNDVLEDEHDRETGRKTRNKVVLGVTMCTKFFMVAGVQIPVLAMNIILFWIGARWLVATLGFGEVLLNAVALEFVLNLHEIFYKAVVPYTMQSSLGSILLPQGSTTSEKPNWWNMISAFGIFIVALVLVCLYVWLQQVLPDYNWDIGPACRLFMAGHVVD